MRPTMIVATGNPNKLIEIREILTDFPYELITMKEAGYDISVEENGTSFAENARIKAEAVAKASHALTMADDSGLVIDALGGEPGIYSARYLGEETSYDYKNGQILLRMKDVPEEKRSARFVCAVCVIFPDGRKVEVEESFEGRIAYEPAGSNGFGYDPIFFVPEYGCTSAELPPQVKNEISHRGKALRAVSERMQ